MQQDCTCSHCGSDNTQRLRLIYESGASEFEFTSLGGAFTGNGASAGGAHSTGTHRTRLSASAGPPRKASEASIWLAMGALALFLILVFPPWGLLLVLLASPALVWLGKRLTEGLRHHNEKHWRPAFERWQRTFLCLRCGERFERDTL